MKLIDAKRNSSTPSSNSSPEVSLQLDEFSEMEKYMSDQVVSFLYTGKITFWDTKDAEMVIGTAKKYDLQVLVNLCEDFLLDSLHQDDVDVAMATFEKAQTLQLGRLIKKCKFVFGIHFENLPLPFWRKLSEEVVLEIIQSSFLVVENESIVLDRVMVWVADLDDEQKMSCLQKMMPKIRFEHMSSRQLLDVETSAHGKLVDSIKPQVIQNALEARAFIAETIQVCLLKQLNHKKIDKLSDELLKEVDKIPPPRIYWNFDEPGCKAADGQTEITLQVHEDKHFQKQSVNAVHKDADHMWKGTQGGKFKLIGGLEEMDTDDAEWKMKLELYPSIPLYKPSKYAVAVSIPPSTDSLRSRPIISFDVGNLKGVGNQTIRLKLGTGILGENQPTEIKIRLAIYIWM